MDGLTDRGSHLFDWLPCPALNNNARRDPHFPCHRQKTDNEGSPRFDAVDADQTSLVIVDNLISHRGSRTNPTGACSHASPCFYRLLQQQPAAPGLSFVRERRGSVPWNSYQLSLSLLFLRAAKTREATPLFIIVIIDVVSAVAGNFTYVPDYNRAAIALPTPRNRGCGSFFTFFRGWLLPTKNVSQNDDTLSPCLSWNQGCFLEDEKKKGAEKRSMSINQSLLSTNTLSFITNTWNQSQASCEPTLREKGKKSRGREVSASIKTCCPPTHFQSSQTHGINHKLLVDRPCERKKRGRRREVWALIKACCPPTHFYSSQTYGINHKLLWDGLVGLLLQTPFVNNCIKQLLRYLRLLLLLLGLPSWTKVPSKHPPPPPSPLLGFLS